MQSLQDMPTHVTNTISFVGLLAICAAVSIAGMALGAPQALWVWIIPFFYFFYEGGNKCKCPNCTGKMPESEKVGAEEIIKRQYVRGNISDEKLEATLNRVEQISEADDDRLEKAATDDLDLEIEHRH